MRCLLVDDEVGIREGLAALLRLKGHAVRTAADVGAALTALHEQEFDLVCTDWRLPDGTAAPLVEHAACPVIAVSGHPEEVTSGPALRAVLEKPVSPARLLELLAGIAAADDAAAAGDPAARGTQSGTQPGTQPETEPVTQPGILPIDVAAIVGQVQECLGDATVRIVDDGSFITLSAPLPAATLLPRLHDLGGDLRVLAPAGRPVLELRLCRDGRPEAAVPAVAPLSDWPVLREFAVDFDLAEVGAGQFLGCLDRAAELQRGGVRVHFLNVPPALVAVAEVSGRGHDMPKKELVGPRLPAVFADLWS